MIVRHARGAYPIERIAPDALIPQLPEDCRIIADSNTRRLLPPDLAVFEIPVGEASKSLAMYADVAGTILRSNPRRQTVLVAVGGGVVGDLVGFVAATL
ncbi:MAG: hypothetical protein SFX74_02765, partial [Fimbriimonadaceae bacterium]|nr:hypothetical protein [Fimbriimonadaceae bacterium]